MTRQVKPLKKLGQHFLVDQVIAEQITDLLEPNKLNYNTVLEIGPGTGVLSRYLKDKHFKDYFMIEIDDRSVSFLKGQFPELSDNILHEDFLSSDLSFIGTHQFAIIGNYPYNISSQILFRLLDIWEQVPELVGMFQNEVAKRICSGPGNKTYGILSVLLQAYYTTSYMFEVPPDKFDPPPKVNSGVIRLQRKSEPGPGCDAKKFKTVVKTAFNQRRKTLRNSLKPLVANQQIALPFADKRPEQLGFEQFAEIVHAIYP